MRGSIPNTEETNKREDFSEALLTTDSSPHFYRASN